MNDIFKDMQVKVGCEYISDLPSYKRKVWHEMKRLNPADYEERQFMYRQLSSDMQEEYTALLTVYENLEALYICRNVITVYHDCKIMIDVARQKLMNDPTFKHLSEDCQEYYFDFEAYASHLQEQGTQNGQTADCAPLLAAVVFMHSLFYQFDTLFCIVHASNLLPQKQC